MEKTKYIVYKNQKGETQSLMFPMYLEHAKMARMNMAEEVLGAGFCRIGNNKGKLTLDCYGHSVSLNISSRGRDDSLKLQIDYFGMNYDL